MQGGLFDYALQTAYGTASYEDYYTSSLNRVNNRFNAPPSVDGDNDGDSDGSSIYNNWLNFLYSDSSGIRMHYLPMPSKQIFQIQVGLTKVIDT